MRRICLLGPNSGIGKVILRYISELTDTKIIKVVRNITNNENEIFWDYQSSLPVSIVNADIVINCARSQDFSYNVKFNKILYKKLSRSTKFINFSSNCIYAKPNYRLSNLLFKGDAYIREKKAIEKMNTSPNHYLIRPTIVTGESNWNIFLSNVKDAKHVILPNNCKKSILKITTTECVAMAVFDLINNNFPNQTESELYTQKITINEFLLNKVIFSNSNAIYFENYLKNLLLHILTSRFMPTFLVFRLQTLLIKGNTRNQSNNKCKNLEQTIEGMTRLYLCGKHTL
jgi:dTDP-4-dehydrorhamnose reductase